MQILVLGDCATNCNNCLAHKIYNDPKLQIERSLWYHIVSKKDVVKKFLKDKKHNPIRVTQLEDFAIRAYKQEMEYIKKDYTIKYKDYNEKTFVDWYLKANNKQPTIYNKDLWDAKNYLVAEELKLAWPNLLPYNVTNLSIPNNHYGNYLLQLVDYIKKIGKPDIVLLCDMYTQKLHEGRWIHFKHKGLRHSYILNDRYLEKKYTIDLGYSKDVYLLKQKLYKKQKNLEQKSIHKRAYRYRKVLENFLEKNDIKFKFVLSRVEERKFVEHSDYIDITDIVNTWHIPNQYQISSTENSKIKFDTQQEIAEFITRYLEQLN